MDEGYADLLRTLVEDRAGPVYLCAKAERELRQWCRDRARSSAMTIQRLYDAGHFKKARRARAHHLTRVAVQADALFIAVRKRWPLREEMSLPEREAIRRRRLQAVCEKLPQVGKMKRPARETVSHQQG